MTSSGLPFLQSYACRRRLALAPPPQQLTQARCHVMAGTHPWLGCSVERLSEEAFMHPRRTSRAVHACSRSPEEKSSGQGVTGTCSRAVHTYAGCRSRSAAAARLKSRGSLYASSAWPVGYNGQMIGCLNYPLNLAHAVQNVFLNLAAQIREN